MQNDVETIQNNNDGYVFKYFVFNNSTCFTY